MVVHLEGGAELRLGAPADLKQKMTVAADIIQEYLRDGKTLEYVDRERRGPCWLSRRNESDIVPF